MLATDDGARWALTKHEAKTLAAIMGAANRPNIHGICFDVDRRWAAATDGHRALVAMVDGDRNGQPGKHPGKRDSRRVLVPGDTVQQAIKAARTKDLIVFNVKPGKGVDGFTFRVYTPPRDLDWTDTGTTVDSLVAASSAGVSATFREPPAAAFPPIAQVIPDYTGRSEASPMVALNADYLAAITELGKLQPDRCVPVRVWHATALDPVLCMLDTDHGVMWRYLVMPMRDA